MNGIPDRIDPITERFERESASLRQRTILLTLVPILVGAAVVGVSYFTIQGARAELAELDRRIAEKQAVLDHFENQLPASARNMLQGLDALRQSDYDLAVQKLQGVVEAEPSFAEARFNLGLALAAKGDKVAAEAEVKEAIRTDPSYKERLESLPPAAKKRLDLRRLPGDQAPGRTPSADLAPSPDRTPNLDRSRAEAELIEQGLVAIDRGELAVASERFSQVLTLNPDNFEALALQGQAHLRAGELGAAEESLRRAVELDEGFAEGHFDLALVLWRSGDRGGAVAQMERALELDPRLRLRAREDPEYRRMRLWQQQTEGPG